MPSVVSDGLRISYEVVGQKGEPILFIPGLSADSSMWMTSVLTYLAFFRSILIDPRDTPKSDESAGAYAPADSARDAIAVLDHCGESAAHVVGFSLGGAVAQEMAGAYPERVKSLTLVCTWVKTDDWLRHCFEWLLEGLNKAGSDWADDAILWLTLSFRFHTPDFYQGFKAFMSARGQSVRGLAGQLRSAIGHDASISVKSIECPVFVIGAADDVFVPQRYSRALNESIRGSYLRIIDGASHGLPIEMADDFMRLLADNFGKHENY